MEAAESNDSVSPKRPSLFQNWISYFGVILAACSFFAVAVLLVLDYLRPASNPYLGILTYVVAPAFLVAGLVLISFGALVERRRRRKHAPSDVPRFPRIDLNVPRQRAMFLVITLVTVVFLLMTAFGSYRTYHFTESVQFCGETCHTVMEPEFVAYQHSPHANVACVECHVGGGADHYLRSKLSGVRQLASVIKGDFSRPIPTPVHNMRPANETCASCHWADKNHGHVARTYQHFHADEQNSEWTIQMLLNVGGGAASDGKGDGIHWHMNIANKVEYIAADPQRQKIPWIRATSPDGKVTIYESEDGKLTPEQIAAATPRVMDCMDCHNRPAHQFVSPVHAVNTALASGRISAKIPFIKQQAVTALTKEYKTKDEARRDIAAALNEFYNAKYPDFARENAALLRKAVESVQAIYARNFFPEMKTDWRAHPDNIGHSQSLGCFRCHDGKHISADKKAISSNCNLCHVITAQGRGSSWTNGMGRDTSFCTLARWGNWNYGRG